MVIRIRVAEKSRNLNDFLVQTQKHETDSTRLSAMIVSRSSRRSLNLLLHRVFQSASSHSSSLSSLEWCKHDSSATLLTPPSPSSCAWRDDWSGGHSDHITKSMGKDVWYVEGPLSIRAPTRFTSTPPPSSSMNSYSNFSASSLPPDSHTPEQFTGRQLVVTASGTDQPGIVSRLTKRVLESGGNVEESRMTRLAGDFCIIMLITINASIPKKAEEVRNRLMEIDGLQVQTRWTKCDRSHESRPTRKFRRISLRAADNPGLVYNVTEYLASNNINIENLDTSTEEAPFGGVMLFMMEGVIAMPIEMSTRKLMQHLDTLQSALSVEIKVSNMDPSKKTEDLTEWRNRLSRPGATSIYSIAKQPMMN